MNERNKKLMAFVAFLIVVALLLLFLKRNPAIVQKIESAVAPAVGGVFTVPDIGSYIPRDYPLPPLLDNAYINFGCNFCSKTSVQVVPPTLPVSQPAQQISPSIFQPQPFGGGTTDFTQFISARG
jgi:hypothetical protein